MRLNEDRLDPNGPKILFLGTIILFQGYQRITMVEKDNLFVAFQLFGALKVLVGFEKTFGRFFRVTAVCRSYGTIEGNLPKDVQVVEAFLLLETFQGRCLKLTAFAPVAQNIDV